MTPATSRVYLPTTLTTLASAYLAGRFEAGHAAHAVTAAIREWYVEGDLEELEYAALAEAAEASLRLLAAEVGAAERYRNRRVVVSADVEPGCVRAVADAPGGIYRSAAGLTCPVLFSAVVSVHLDDELAAGAVADAVLALPAADAGDDDAQFTLDQAQAHELLWYDVTEIPDLL